MTLYNEMIREISSQLLENEGSSKQKLEVEEKTGAYESISYKEKVVQVLKRK